MVVSSTAHCPAMDEIDHATVHYNCDVELCPARVSCDQGYKLHGDSVFSCQSDGSWYPSNLPNCSSECHIAKIASWPIHVIIAYWQIYGKIASWQIHVGRHLHSIHFDCSPIDQKLFVVSPLESWMDSSPILLIMLLEYMSLVPASPMYVIKEWRWMVQQNYTVWPMGNGTRTLHSAEVSYDTKISSAWTLYIQF